MPTLFWTRTTSDLPCAIFSSSDLSCGFVLAHVVEITGEEDPTALRIVSVKFHETTGLRGVMEFRSTSAAIRAIETEARRLFSSLPDRC